MTYTAGHQPITGGDEDTLASLLQHIKQFHCTLHVLKQMSNMTAQLQHSRFSATERSTSHIKHTSTLLFAFKHLNSTHALWHSFMF